MAALDVITIYPKIRAILVNIISYLTQMSIVFTQNPFEMSFVSS